MATVIPKCEDNEGAIIEGHCWHPGSMAARAPMGQRCCHCGLDFCIQLTPLFDDKKHGKHVKVSQGYKLVFDTTFQDMYREDPETFEKLAEAMEEGRRDMEDFYRSNPPMSGF